MKRPTYVGGEPATFVCVHLIVPSQAQTPVWFAYSSDPDKHRRETLQIYHWVDLSVRALYWVPDRGLAQRIETECRRVAEDAKLRGRWYDLEVASAERLIVQCAQSLAIPVLSDAQHDSLRLDADQIDALQARRSGVYR